MLEIFDGDIPVIFYLEDTKQKLAAHRRLYTSGHPLFFEELQRLWGEKMLQQNDMICAGMIQTAWDDFKFAKNEHQDVRL